MELTIRNYYKEGHDLEFPCVLEGLERHAAIREMTAVPEDEPINRKEGTRLQ